MHKDRWEVYETHVEAIERYASRRVEPDAVDDIVAETFAVAWRRLPRDDEPHDWVLPWLYEVAKRIIHTHHRRHRNGLRLLARIVGHRDPAAPDAAELIVEDPALARAFATLTPTEREAIRLIAWEGLSRHDAARVAGCSEPTFSVRYSRARSHLAAALETEHPSPVEANPR
jgi:RNA polymerase sigma factor (sigma-70 family)